jgi:hypothetical protein
MIDKPGGFVDNHGQPQGNEEKDWMKLDTGTVITIAVVLMFYLRLMLLQWGKSKRFKVLLEREKKKGKNPKKLQADLQQHLGIKVISWPLITFGLALVVAGASVRAIPGVSAEISQYWWVMVSTGVLFSSFSIR